MPVLAISQPVFYARCLRAKRPLDCGSLTSRHQRQYANATGQCGRADGPAKGDDGDGDAQKSLQQDVKEKTEPKEQGALTRRLRDMSEAALESGDYGAVRAVQESGGFSNELMAELEHRIASAHMRSSEVELPQAAAASRQTRDLATAVPWTGAESVHDASFRMLNDAHRPLRATARTPKIPGVQPLRTVDTGHGRSSERESKSLGQRLANARDRSSLYAHVKDDPALDAMERETRFQLLKDRFDPHARTITPGTISGIAALASQRIEDAIARGQFKNIPRGTGTGVVRDHNASSPFIDTTEYFLNKIIQKQDIVPPWIEKQQELVSAANKFRTRLRHDWKRHAARMISSQGGSLQDQVERADAYAKAELISNPPKTQHGVASTVHSSSVSPASFPFRDPDWERTETPYFTLAIKELNDKARSYNLQAPELAKKPYFNLQRELNACYADMAPHLPNAILDRALTPPKKAENWHRSGEKGILGSMIGGPVRVRDERREKHYGFRQFWKDLWQL